MNREYDIEWHPTWPPPDREESLYWGPEQVISEGVEILIISGFVAVFFLLTWSAV